jgi:hypothetical protein
MSRFEGSEKLLGIQQLSAFCLFEALPDSFASVGPGGDIEQSLIRRGVLHDGRGFTVNREDNRTTVFPEPFQKIPGAAAECGG